MQQDLSLIDTHCHLDAPEFDAGRDHVVADARRQGVTRIVVPAIAAGNFAATLAMRDAFGCLIAFGLHPMYCRQHLDDHLALLEQAIIAHRPVAVGEIGLDGWEADRDLHRQEALFIEQLKLAKKHGLPVLLHVRKAQDRVLRALRQVRVVGGIAHAFNGSEQQAQAFIALGFKLGFGGAMTYQGSQRIRRLAATLPLDTLVLETDAPDIRPAWAQDIPNTPANLRRFAEELALLRNESVAAIAAATTYNAGRVLGFAGSEQ
jgi:TatD DNase family protein